jgi:hypothetical protein
MACSLAAVLAACGGGGDSGGGNSGGSANLSGGSAGNGSINTASNGTNTAANGSGNGSTTATSGSSGSTQTVATGSGANVGATTGSTSPQGSALVFPVSAAFSSFLGTASTYHLSGGDNQGNSYQLVWELVPGAVTADTSRKTTLIKSRLTFNGETPILGEATTTYTDGPFTLHGGTYAYTQFPNRQSAPMTATVGSSGPLASGYEAGVDPATGDNASSDVSQTITWSLESDTATTAWLCINTTTQSAPVTIEKNCARINESGSILGFRSSVVVGSLVVNLR